MHLSSFLGSLTKHQHASCEAVRSSPPGSSLVRLDPRPLHNSCPRTCLLFVVPAVFPMTLHSALVCLISLNPGGDFVSHCVGEHGVVFPSHSIPVSLPLASPSHLRRLWCGVWWHLCMLHWSLSSLSLGDTNSFLFLFLNFMGNWSVASPFPVPPHFQSEDSDLKGREPFW